MKLDKQTVKAAQSLIRKSPEQVKESAVLRNIVEELEIDDIRDKKIYLTPSKLVRIEEYFSKALGVPILEVDLNVETRFEASNTFSEEKWASGGVFEVMLSMTGRGVIPVKEGDLEAQPHIVYSMKPRNIYLSRIEKLIVVENGELITNWELVIPFLPRDYQDALAIFRGYGTNQKYLNDLLREVNPDSKIGLFFDYDAAGIDMALKLAEYQIVDLIVPRKLPESVVSKSKSEEFDKQFEQLIKRLNSSKTPEKVKDVLRNLKHNKLAITQEHLITHGVSLDLIKNVGETI
ncbi:hypothetical protein Q4575_15345 [Psychrosphaera sp. 1_MG-2023]|uniref:DUF7281 domain-containing protein n=1 Tax=Psychrosphaera sp. 1_MG-2023 TaxID=3062643 RepID=UPI0026E44A20|nr:hypothetical protein [Psychrosphaera sp. 1_MG-2023]MDO6720788.1 hypothetical protein [Psychrosphaera sp. 1_MG-2023]